MIRLVASACAAVTMAITASLLPCPARADQGTAVMPPTATETRPVPVEEDVPPAEPSMLFRSAEKTHIAVSNSLERLARNIDAFFAAEQAFHESTRSYARVRIDTKLDQDFQLGFDGDVRVKIDLPRTERKLKLLIESDDVTRTGTPERLNETPIDVVRRQDYLLSIERVNEVNKWDVRPAAGIKLRWIPDPFVRLRATRYHQLDVWLLRTSASTFWFTSDGFGANSTLDLDRPVGESMFFRGTTVLRWQENDQFLTAEQQLSLYQRLDPKRYLVYQVGARANQDPDWAMQYYFVSVHYRKNVYKNWLFFEFIPQIDYQVEKDFEALPSITFRIEGVFGHDYL